MVVDFESFLPSIDRVKIFKRINKDYNRDLESEYKDILENVACDCQNHFCNDCLLKKFKIKNTHVNYKCKKCNFSIKFSLDI